MSKVLSIHGKSLKLDTRADLEPWIKDVDPTIIEEVHFGGNTIGVEAAEALAEFLTKATSIKVRPWLLTYVAGHRLTSGSRSQILQIYLQVV